MPNLKINDKTYYSVNEVHIPLADGSGNEDFAYIGSGAKSITANGTHDVKHYGTVNVAVPTDSHVELQTKSVTPSETAQTVTPDSGYDGLSSVSVGAISSTYVGRGVTKKEAQTYTPGTSNQTIASGQYLNGSQTILGDDDLRAYNIKKGVSIFNVTGTYEGTGSGGGIDTSDATATENDIEEGKTAYVNGAKVTGTLSELDMINAENVSDFRATMNCYIVAAQSPRKGIVQAGGLVGLKTAPSLFGTCKPEDVRQGVTFTSENGLRAAGTLVVSGNNPVLQSKTVSPTTSQQTVTPDSGYEGLSQVTVNAMPTVELAKPSISISSNGYVTASVTQEAGYVTGGTQGTTKPLPTMAATTYTPTTEDQTIDSGLYLTGTQTIKGDTNLTASNIKSGVSIFNVLGTYLGESGGGGGLPGYITALASEKYTPPENKTSREDVKHGLGVTPNFCVVIVEDDFSATPGTSMLVGATVFYKKTKYSNTNTTVNTVHIAMEGYSPNSSVAGSATRAASDAYFTNTTFGIPCNGTYPLKAGYTYRWVCGVMEGIQ